MVQLDYAFGQWKSDPRAGSLGDIRDTVFSLIESVEYFVYIFFADTDTVVDNFNGTSFSLFSKIISMAAFGLVYLKALDSRL